jgi:hypothetical protein
MHCINEAEKQLLKDIIGQNLICFKSQKPDAWNHVFGNIAIIAENLEIEIRNELTPTEYFGDSEDISRFYVKQISEERPFRLMVDDSVVKTVVNEKVSDILIVQDSVTVRDSNGALVYEIAIDTAIVIKTEKSTFAISRDWSLEELLVFVKTANFENDIYSVQQMIEEWSDEEELWTASCDRKNISLIT